MLVLRPGIRESVFTISNLIAVITALTMFNKDHVTSLDVCDAIAGSSVPGRLIPSLVDQICLCQQHAVWARWHIFVVPERVMLCCPSEVTNLTFSAG
jgi:hypothetical protein